MQGCRALTLDDIPWAVHELRQLPTQSKKFGDVPDDPAYVEDYFRTAWSQGLFGVCMQDENSHAFLIAHAGRPWWANRIEVSELILWVPEKERGGRNAVRLIKAFTELALDYEPHSIHAGASLDITEADRTLRLYEMCGYIRDGIGVIMRP